jgi:hypothetical protein
MPKLLRTLVPLVLVLLAIPASASADPMDFNTTHSGAMGANLPHTPNFVWLSSTMANSSVAGTAAPGEGWASGTGGQGLSDLMFQEGPNGHDYVIQGEYTHYQTWDYSDPRNPVRVGPNVRCTGSQGDIMIVGHLMMRVNENNRNIPNADLTRPCAVPQPGETSVGFLGLTIIDVSDWNNPRPIIGVPVCNGAHTATKYYNDITNKLYVIMTRGGTTGSSTQWGLDCSAAARPTWSVDVVEVPLDHPENAHLVGWLPTGGSGGDSGCHDINVFEELHLMATSCPSGGSQGSLVDISDINNPKVLWTFRYPGISTMHTADFSWNGRYIYWNAEPGGGTGDSCNYNDDPLLYTVFIVDRFTGKLLGQYHAPNPQATLSTAGGATIENCTIHEINEIPFMDRNVMTYAGYRMGGGVVDLTNPRAPRNIGFFDYPPSEPSTGPASQGGFERTGLGCWTFYWYNDNLYCNDLSWGMIVYTVNEPWWKQALTMNELNPQTTTFRFRCTASVSGPPLRAKKKSKVTATLSVTNGHEIKTQPAWGLTVVFKAPGFYKEVKTGENGKATATVKASKRGKLQVSTLTVENVNSCAAPAKSIKRAIKR